MTISVCMCTYNGEKFIGEQLESIFNQVRQPDEVIICDDGSMDSTVKIISEYIGEKHLEAKWKLYVNEINKGYPGNFYYAMSLCTGDVVFLSDQDDIWNLNKLQIMGDILECDKNVNVLASKFGLIDEKGKSIHSIFARDMHKNKKYLTARDNCKNLNVRSDHKKIKKLSLAGIFYKYETPGMVLAYRNDRYREREIVSSAVPHDFLICVTAAEESSLFQTDSVLAYHRIHANNVAEEEYRPKKLLNKKRKLKEISKYIRYLQALEKEKHLKNPEAQAELTIKLHSMEGRYAALCSGRISKVLQNAAKYKRITRPATVICDLLIVGQKCISEKM